nr:MAG TPA: hypothetical protein [Caudoviricetes sp.]
MIPSILSLFAPVALNLISQLPFAYFRKHV